MLIDGKKVACATCIKGHRATHCKHKDRPMVEIKKKGRPATQCPRCRELRVVRQLHVKCSCYDEKELKRARSTNDQDSKMIKKLVIDISKAKLRAIAPRPKKIPDSPLEQKQPPLVNDHPIFSHYPFPPRTSSSSPPPSNLSVVSPLPHQTDYATLSFAPLPTKSTPCPSLTPQTTVQPVSNCQCRPGSSCGCKLKNGGKGSCCGSSTLSPTQPSSCCGSSTLSPTQPSSSYGLSTLSPTQQPSSCCGSSSLPPTQQPPSCCGSSSLSPTQPSSCSRSSTLPSTQQPSSCCTPSVSPPPPTGQLSSCCGSSPSSSISSPSSITSSHTYEPSKSSSSSPMESPLLLKPKPTMCADGLGKSSCCSSKQRNAMGETIRLVTCRCGDSCACIGCDAHPSRAMKSSQQDPYAGYTDDVSQKRRRLSIAAICGTVDKMDMPTSVLAENGTPLCGCGCSNALTDCTSCFQELCQDYYAAQ